MMQTYNKNIPRHFQPSPTKIDHGLFDIGPVSFCSSHHLQAYSEAHYAYKWYVLQTEL